METIGKAAGDNVATTSSWQRLVATIDKAGNDLATTSSWQRLVATVDKALNPFPKAVGNDLGIDLVSRQLATIWHQFWQLALGSCFRLRVLATPAQMREYRNDGRQSCQDLRSRTSSEERLRQQGNAKTPCSPQPQSFAINLNARWSIVLCEVGCHKLLSNAAAQKLANLFDWMLFATAVCLKGRLFLTPSLKKRCIIQRRLLMNSERTDKVLWPLMQLACQLAYKGELHVNGSGTWI